MNEPFWRDPYSFGFYRKSAESKTWQAVCPQCFAEFTEAHLCPITKIQNEIEKKYKELEELEEEIKLRKNELAKRYESFLPKGKDE